MTAAAQTDTQLGPGVRLAKAVIAAQGEAEEPEITARATVRDVELETIAMLEAA